MNRSKRTFNCLGYDSKSILQKLKSKRKKGNVDNSSVLFVFSNVVTFHKILNNMTHYLAVAYSYYDGKNKRFNSKLKNDLKSVGLEERGANLTWMLSVLYLSLVIDA